jgi:hypothetical protein
MEMEIGKHPVSHRQIPLPLPSLGVIEFGTTASL